MDRWKKIKDLAIVATAGVAAVGFSQQKEENVQAATTAKAKKPASQLTQAQSAQKAAQKQVNAAQKAVNTAAKNVTKTQKAVDDANSSVKSAETAVNEAPNKVAQAQQGSSPNLCVKSL